MKTKNEKASVFELNGIPSLKEAFPLALQHVVAMIVGPQNAMLLKNKRLLKYNR